MITLSKLPGSFSENHGEARACHTKSLPLSQLLSAPQALLHHQTVAQGGMKSAGQKTRQGKLWTAAVSGWPASKLLAPGFCYDSDYLRLISTTFQGSGHAHQCWTSAANPWMICRGRLELDIDHATAFGLGWALTMAPNTVRDMTSSECNCPTILK